MTIGPTEYIKLSDIKRGIYGNEEAQAAYGFLAPEHVGGDTGFSISDLLSPRATPSQNAGTAKAGRTPE